MSINYYERLESGDTETKDKGEGGSRTLLYGVQECSDQATAEALILSVAPLAVSTANETLVRTSVKSSPQGPDLWYIDVEYSPESKEESQQKPEPGTWKFEFDTSGATQLITSAPLVARYGSSSFGDAPDLQGALNYDGKKVKGLEIPIPNGRFSITQYFDARQVTPALMVQYMRATPRYNLKPWLGVFDSGECLYRGSKAQGDIPTVAGQRVQPIGVRHEFEASENQIGITEIEGIDQNGKYGPGAFDSQGNPLNGQPTSSLDKKGWEYLWTWFKKRKDEDESRVVPRPAYVYVHAPIKPMDFAAFFGFGGS